MATPFLLWHADRVVALEEGHAPIEIDPVSLETRGVWNFASRLPGNLTAQAAAAFPSADDAQEGEGYLLTVVYDEARNASHLVVLDAQSIERPLMIDQVVAAVAAVRAGVDVSAHHRERDGRVAESEGVAELMQDQALDVVVVRR